MKMLVSTLMLLVAATGCAKMKEKMGEMKDNVKKSSSQAQSKYDSEVQKRVNPNGSSAQDPGPPQDGGATASGAAAGGAAATTSSMTANDGSSSNGSATSGGESETSSGGGDASSGVTDTTTAAADGSDAGGSADASTGGDTSGFAGYVPDCSKPNNAPEAVDVTGTERWQWTDAQKGAYMRFRMTNNTEMSYDVKDATDKLVLIETRTSMNGQLLSCSLDWQPRLFKKPDVAATENEKIDFETKTTDLPDETVEVGGKSVKCRVRRVWTRYAQTESTSVIWTSTEVPGEMVKTASETDKGLETVYQLVEWRS